MHSQLTDEQTVVVPLERSTNVINERVQVITVESPRGRTGDTGNSGTGVAIQYNFAFGDATPATIATVAAGKAVYRVECCITESFDGIGATVLVGDATVNDRLLSTEHVDLTTIGQYQSNPAHEYLAQAVVQLRIIPGANASSGAGFILIYIEV